MGIEGFKKTRGEKYEIVDEEHLTTEEFEHQFNEELLLEFEGHDPIPYTVVIPKNLTSEDWVVYVGGFGQGKISYLDEIKNLAHSGRKVLYTNPINGIKVGTEGRTIKVPDTIINKSNALHEVLKKVDADRVDFIGHSQGAAVITTYASTHPGVAKKLILECPAGTLGGNDSTEKIIGRFAVDKISSLISNTEGAMSASSKRSGRSFINEVLVNYKDISFRLNQEIPGVATVDIAPLLKEIKEIDNKTEIVLINANEDKVFPKDEIDRMLGENPLEYVDRWAMYANKKASHGAPVAERAGLLQQILEK